MLLLTDKAGFVLLDNDTSTLGCIVASILFALASTSHSSNTFVSVAYLSPVITASTLAVFYPNEIIGLPVIAAMMVILFGNLFLHFSRGTLSAGAVTAMITLLATALCLITDPLCTPGSPLTHEWCSAERQFDTNHLLGYADILTALFAILVSFTLFCLHERDRQIEQAQVNVGLALEALMQSHEDQLLNSDEEHTSVGATEDHENDPVLLQRAEALLAAMIDSRLRVPSVLIEGVMSQPFRMLDALHDHISKRMRLCDGLCVRRWIRW